MGSDVNVPEEAVEATVPVEKAFGVYLPAEMREELLDAAAPAIRSQERERLLAWLVGDEAIQAALKRKRLTEDAVGIAGLPKPTPENAMGAILVAVRAAARTAFGEELGE